MARISHIIDKLLTNPLSYQIGLLLLGAVRFKRDAAIRADGFRRYCHAIDRLIAAGKDPANYFSVIDSLGLRAWVIDEANRRLTPVTPVFREKTAGDATGYWNLILLKDAP